MGMINEKWPLLLLPDRDDFHLSHPKWEAERLDSMHLRLRPLDVLVDVGSECGDLPALFATWGCKLVLIEANPDYWPSIRWHFEANGLEPLACWPGFAASVTDVSPRHVDYDPGMAGAWPQVAYQPVRVEPGFRHLGQDLDRTPRITIDTLVASRGITVDAMTLDVEGSELRVLHGAEHVLQHHRPHSVWISVHTDEVWMRRVYPAEGLAEVDTFMDFCGYTGITLAIDHEHHRLYTPT